jgi:hypothetical protein
VRDHRRSRHLHRYRHLHHLDLDLDAIQRHDVVDHHEHLG